MNQGSKRGAHLAGKLARDRAPGDVDQLLGQHGRGRQVIARREQPGDDRGDRREIRRFRPVGVEPRRRGRSAGQHDVVADRVFVVRMRQERTSAHW